jgi:hypothetical protein
MRALDLPLSAVPDKLRHAQMVQGVCQQDPMLHLASLPARGKVSLPNHHVLSSGGAATSWCTKCCAWRLSKTCAVSPSVLTLLPCYCSCSPRHYCTVRAGLRTLDCQQTLPVPRRLVVRAASLCAAPASNCCLTSTGQMSSADLVCQLLGSPRLSGVLPPG